MYTDIESSILECIIELEQKTEIMRKFPRVFLVVVFLAILISIIFRSLLVYAIIFLGIFIYVLAVVMIDSVRIHNVLKNILNETHHLELNEYRNSNIMIGVSNNYLSFFLRSHKFEEEKFKSLQVSYRRYANATIMATFVPFIIAIFGIIVSLIFSVILAG